MVDLRELTLKTFNFTRLRYKICQVTSTLPKGFISAFYLHQDLWNERSNRRSNRSNFTVSNFISRLNKFVEMETLWKSSSENWCFKIAEHKEHKAYGTEFWESKQDSLLYEFVCYCETYKCTNYLKKCQSIQNFMVRSTEKYTITKIALNYLE